MTAGLFFIALKAARSDAPTACASQKYALRRSELSSALTGEEKRLPSTATDGDKLKVFPYC